MKVSIVSLTVAAALSLAGLSSALAAGGSASRVATVSTATHGKPMAAGGARQALLGTIKRSNGSRQVTYAGHPLYTYLLDTRRGQTKREGSTLFGAGWDALTPGGKKIESDGG
jgi:hypothetical protein